MFPIPELWRTCRDKGANKHSDGLSFVLLLFARSVDYFIGFTFSHLTE